MCVVSNDYLNHHTLKQSSLYLIAICSPSFISASWKADSSLVVSTDRINLIFLLEGTKTLPFLIRPWLHRFSAMLRNPLNWLILQIYWFCDYYQMPRFTTVLPSLYRRKIFRSSHISLSQLQFPGYQPKYMFFHLPAGDQVFWTVWED